MATAVMEQTEQSDVELERSIAALDAQIGRARLDCAEWQDKEKNTSSAIADLRAQLAEESERLALGKGKPGAGRKLTEEIGDLEIRLAGVQRILISKRSAMSELQSALVELQQQQSRRTQARIVVEERTLVEKMVNDCDQALSDLNAAAQRFGNGLVSIRQHVYLDEKNKHYGFDEAFRLQRLSSGMRA